MYKSYSKINLKKRTNKPIVKTVIRTVNSDNSHLLDEIDNLKLELEKNNEILDKTFLISNEQEDRIKQLSRRLIENEKIVLTKKEDDISDIITKSELMLKNIKRDSLPKIKRPLIKPETKPEVKPVRSSTRKTSLVTKKKDSE
jgi:hypothetical protein